MKKKFTLLLALCTIFFSANKLFAQSLTDPLKISDLDPYFSSYMEPFAKAMSVSLSGGWTHTAKVHSTLGFDISFSASIVKIPEIDKTFDGSSADFSPYTISGTVPTISAKNDVAQPDLTRPITVNNPLGGAPLTSSYGFSAMPGIGIPVGGMAAIQAGVGLPKGTEVMVRFIPNIAKTINKAVPSDVDFAMEKTGMWGLGVKHDIKQWIPAISKVPFLQISGMLTYSKFYTGFSGADMRITPEKLSATDNAPTADWTSQRFHIDMSSFTGSILVGANIPVFQPFVGLGFNSAKFDGGFLGEYPVVDFIANSTDLTVTNEVNTTEMDPLTVKTKMTNFNLQVGARLKLGPIVFFYALTAQKYIMHSGGLAVTIR